MTGPRTEAAPWAAIAGALALSAAGILVWIGRGSLFSVDDLLWFMGSPGLDLEGLLQPHNGHLIVTSRLAYHVVFELFGADYAPIRVLTAASAALSGFLFYVWASRRVAAPVALAGSALLLFLGSSYIFLIAGDGLMVQLAVAAGLGALLALERRDRFGDALACVLLCFGVVTYSVALAFVAAAAVAVLVDPSRRTRAWVPAIPVLLYAAWWLWAQGQEVGAGQEADIANLLELPVYAFESLSSALGALTGLDLEFTAEQTRPEFDTTELFAGPLLAAVAIIAFVWRIRRPPVPAAVWVALGYLAALWVAGALTTDAASPPDSSRFVLFLAVGVLMLAAACASRVRWTGGRVLAVWVVAAFGLGANVWLLLDGADWRRDVETPHLRAELTAVELADERAQSHPDLSRVNAGSAVVNFPFFAAPVGDYVEAARRYGEFGYSLAELRAQSEELRAETDAMLVSTYGTGLVPHGDAVPASGCRRIGEPKRRRGVAFELPARGAAIEADRPATVSARRFADLTTVELGVLEPRRPATLRIPADAAPEPWLVHVAASSARVCSPARP